MNNLTIQEAYKAMYAYLEQLYHSTKSDELGSLLGSMSVIADGETVDPAVWKDWLKAVEKVKSVNFDMGLTLNKR